MNCRGTHTPVFPAAAALFLSVLLLLLGTRPTATAAQDPPSGAADRKPQADAAAVKDGPDIGTGSDRGDKPITLRVTDEAGKPIPAVQIWLEKDYPTFPLCLTDGSRRSAVVTTGDDGTASAIFPPTPANIIVAHKGYAPLFVRAADLTKQSPYPVRLSAGRTLTGRVVDVVGVPRAGVTVTARPGNDRATELMDAFALEDKTDAQGRFELPHAADGTYVVTAHIQDDAVPSYAEPVQAKVLGDGEPPAPLTLLAKPGATLRGTLTTAHGVELGDREVFVYTRVPKRTQWRTKTNANGTFVVHGIPAGSKGAVVFDPPRDYALAIDPGGGGGAARPFFKVRSRDVQFDDVPPGVYDGITVRLLKEAKATGTVTDDAGKPFAGVHVHVEETNYLYQTDAQGKYTAKIPPGQDVTLVVSRSGEVDLSAQPEVKVRAGEGETVVADLKAIRRNLKVPTNAITGRVLKPDGTPAAKISVYLSNHGVLPQHVMNARHKRGGKTPKPRWDGGTFYPATTKTGDDGRFEFDLLEDGTTDVWAVDPAVGWAVALETGSNARDLELKLEPRGEEVQVEGAVVDPSGKPVAGRRVVLFNGDHNQPAVLTEAKTDDQGRFVLRTVPPQEFAKHLRVVCPPAEAPGDAGAAADASALAWRTLPRCSVSGLNVQLQSAAALQGRVMNKQGEPVAGAEVYLYLGRNPKYGEMFFFRATEPFAPRTRTAADGTYALRGLPAEGNVSVYVDHPDYGRGDAWYVSDYAQGKHAPDVEMPDGIVVEGTVRYAGTDKPGAGATVRIGTGVFDETAATVTADDAGRYRLAGLDRGVFTRGRFTVSAQMAPGGAGNPEWEGQAVREGDLYAGDALRDVDVVLERSFAWKLGEWLKHPGAPAPTAARVVVVEDADPSTEGKLRYGDTLRVYAAGGGASGSPLWGYDTLHVTKYSRPAVVGASADRSVWVCEGPGGRVLKFERGGKLQWEKSGLKAAALATHPPTGNAWLLTQDKLIYGKDLVLLDPAGSVVRQVEQPGYALFYSAVDDTFWLVGQKAQKLDRAGKVVCEAAVRFAWMARVVAVNDKDGTAWVVDDRHPDVPDSVNRILLLAPDGRVRREVPLGEAGAADVLLDPERRCAWVPTASAAGSSLLKLSDAGDVLGDYPLPGSSAALEPDTGYVWLAGPQGLFRVDTEGHVVWSERPKGMPNSEEGQRRWVFVVGP